MGRIASRAIAYRRVSTDQQGDSGAGLDAQTAAVDAECRARSIELLATYTDVGSGGSMRRRPELQRALTAMENGEADVLIVAKLDRLSRSLLDFANLMALSQRQGWGIVALDIGVDTSTVNGELIANIIMALAQWERRIIGQRTKDALLAVRERGTKLGRPTQVMSETKQLIKMLRADGRSYKSIADLLNSQNVPTAQGGSCWYKATVRDVELRANRENKVQPTEGAQ